MNNKTTFWNYIKNNVIEIPIIQRDYAQGRLGKENLRKNFLADLKKALDNENPYKNTAMKLDFVYGSTESGKLNPLDGQQRLTTLWLLHWYIALRAGELNKDNCTIFRKFTYETRISSREFCQNLCIPENFENFAGNDIVGFITKQTWFYSAWKQDPTIQSMLRMLGGTKVADKKGEDIVDGIEELFKITNKDEFKGYWQVLTEKEIVVFYHLPLSDFGLSDDLYIKMNARGKQLTSFENFKADLIGYITKKSEDESLDENIQAEWKKLLDPECGIPIKLDTDWTDIFWKNKSTDNRIDEIYFAFLNRFFWNELFITKNNGEYLLKVGRGKLYDGKEVRTIENFNYSYEHLNKDDSSFYYDLTPYKFYDKSIPLDLFKNLALVLYRFNPNISHCEWDKDFKFIPEYDNNDVTKLTQIHRIVFFAICKYYKENVFDSTSMNRWMRVVWNLVSGDGPDGNPQIRDTQAIRNAIEFISELNSHSAYESLTNYSGKLSDTSFDNRCKEEIAKAKQILDEYGKLRKYDGSCKKEDGTSYHTWEEIIIDAEKYAFFKGAIRFLFTDGDGNMNWCDFDKKWGNIKRYFDKNGVIDTYQVPLTKALIIKCDDWENQLLDKQIFNTKAPTWELILTSINWRKPIHNILTTNDLNIISAATTNTDKNIEKYITPLLVSLPYEEIIKNIPDGRFRWYCGRLGFYIRQSESIIFDWENWKRNIILTELYDAKIIFTTQKVDGCELFWGWDVDFQYKNNFFKWYRNYDNRGCDIYLTDQDGNYLRRLNPTIVKETDENTYFCFRVDAKTTPESFTKMLDGLIAQVEADKQTL
jgi:hypothetical protein